MKTFEQAYNESTCQKRVTVVSLYDKNGKLLARESNRCTPEGGTCHRIGLSQDKSNYDVHSHCNWTHAEINAINALKEGDEPHIAILYGHNFYCSSCEEALKAAGVKEFKISKYQP